MEHDPGQPAGRPRTGDAPTRPAQPPRREQPGPPHGGDGSDQGPGLLKSLRTLSGTVSELRDLHARHGELRAEVAALRAEVAEQSSRAERLQLLVHQMRADLSTERDAAHYDTAHAYASLRKRIADVCGDGAHRLSGDRAVRQTLHLRLTAAVCRAGFGELPPTPDSLNLAVGRCVGQETDVLDDVVTRLCQEISGLRATVSELEGTHRWDFELPLGAAFDPDRYELWSGSEHGRPLDSCVAPAYRVIGRKPHVKALVCTAAPSTRT